MHGPNKELSTRVWLGRRGGPEADAELLEAGLAQFEAGLSQFAEAGASGYTFVTHHGWERPPGEGWVLMDTFVPNGFTEPIDAWVTQETPPFLNPDPPFPDQAPKAPAGQEALDDVEKSFSPTNAPDEICVKCIAEAFVVGFGFGLGSGLAFGAMLYVLAALHLLSTAGLAIIAATGVAAFALGMIGLASAWPEMKTQERWEQVASLLGGTLGAGLGGRLSTIAGREVVVRMQPARKEIADAKGKVGKGWRKKNWAKGELEIEGEQIGSILSNSGEKAAKGNVNGTGRYRKSTYTIDKKGYHPGNRSNDSEIKILERAAKKLEKTPYAEGTLRIHTERKPCPSCMDTINKAFKKDHPNIDVRVNWGR